MEWVSTAEEYIGKYGWGSRGRNIGISRMFNDSDKSYLSRHKVYTSIRPRGVLSGFLAIVPTLNYAVYLPPIAAKHSPMRVRMRISEEVQTNGAIFSVYLNREKKMVIEDVLLWSKVSVWNTEPFDVRWNKYVNDFVNNHWRPDIVIQGDQMIELAKYNSLATTTTEPDQNSVIEFIPSIYNTKRLIWIPQKTADAPILSSVPSGEFLSVRKETISGPDVYSVWRGSERLGIGLVKTLAISRTLRLATAESIAVNALWNKQFEKWEIVSVK